MAQYAKYPRQDSVSPGGFSPPADSDAMQASYPSSNVEVYEYYAGGLSGLLLQTVTVTYTDSTKEVISTVVRS